MSHEPRPARWWMPTSGSVVLFVVAVLTGILFTSTAVLFRGAPSERPQNLADLVRVQSNRLELLESEVSDLRRTHRQRLRESETGLPAPSREVLIAAAGSKVRGDGLRVRMWDAPSKQPSDSPFSVNDLVVHQQDIEGVINALWAGGADAVTVMGQRLTVTSAVRCVGNVLLLHGQQYSPPYVIEAIGDRAKLQAALAASPAVSTYLKYVKVVGLGWEVSELQNITMPAYAGPTNLTHAEEIAP